MATFVSLHPQMGFSDIICSLFTQTPVIGGSGPLEGRTIEARESFTRLQVPEATTQTWARGFAGKEGNDDGLFSEGTELGLIAKGFYQRADRGMRMESCGMSAVASTEGAAKGKCDCGAGTFVDSGGFRLGFRDWPRDAEASSGGRIGCAGACVLSLSLSLSFSRSWSPSVALSLFLSFPSSSSVSV